MVYEWDEEVPQPKPPTRRCELLVRFGKDQLDLSSYRPATQADIARALGVTEAQLAAFLKNPHMTCSRLHVYDVSQQGLGAVLGYQGQQIK